MITWRRVVASGAVWTLVYNLVWGVAWFAFMDRVWDDSVAALGRPSPWTAPVWFLWVVLTVPMGVAIMAYATSGAPARSARTAALSASAAVWLLITVGMGAHSLSQGLPVRVIALDASVNLAGMLVASLAGAWSIH